MNFVLCLAVAGRDFIRFSWRLTCFVCASVLAVLTASHIARAQTVPSVVVVVDGSGSMWGKLTGTTRPKFKAATEALSSALRRLRTKPNIGMVAFGQRANIGCNVSETLLKVMTYDEKLFLGAVDQLNPNGRGPVVEGLKRAGEMLSKVSSPRSILIIHDDPDNCGRNICAVATSIKKRMPDLKVHAMTLMPKEANKGAMACLTKQTGGRVIEVMNAGEITSAIDEIITEIKRTQGDDAAGDRSVGSDNGQLDMKEFVLRRKRAVPNTAGLILLAQLQKDGPALQDGLMWKIMRLDGEIENTVARTTESEPSIALTPGRYGVILRTPGFTLRQDIDVKEGRRTVAPFVLGSTAITLSAVLSQGGPIVKDASFMISRIDGSGPQNTIWSGLAPLVPLIVEPGDYKLVVSAGRIRRSHAFTAAAGEKINLRVPLEAGYLNVKTRTSEQTSTDTVSVVSIQTDDPSQPSGRRMVTRTTQTNPNFLLPPGTYYIKIQGQNVGNQEPVAIAAGQIIERTLNEIQMRVRISSRFKGSSAAIDNQLRYRVWRVDASDVFTLTSSSPEPEFDLTPGRYQLEARVGLQNAAIFRAFEITSSPFGKILLDIEAATIALRTAGSNPNIFWEIKDSDHKTIWRTIDPEPTLTLKSGRYKVNLEVGKRTLSRDIVVESGRHMDIEMN